MNLEVVVVVAAAVVVVVAAAAAAAAAATAAAAVVVWAWHTQQCKKTRCSNSLPVLGSSCVRLYHT